MKTVTLGKSRKIRGFKNESWISCKISSEFHEEPTIEDIRDLAGDVELVLLMEEDDERDYWRKQSEGRRDQESGV